MIKSFLLATFSLIFFALAAQENDHKSIHQLQQAFYQSHSNQGNAFFDSINEFKSYQHLKRSKSELQKRVFGYHPYWGGSNYVNYQWDKLTDLSYFSYEVDPSTGGPLTIHDWETSAAIDSALANGVRVHLCVTLFSGHATFFGSATAQQNLIDQIISLIQSRGAHGVNMDVEALPSSQAENFNNFLVDLSAQIYNLLPDAEVSIAAPAVNWSDKFNIPLLKDHIDFFMVMAYDYYWNGSGEAGPVSPLYSMAAYYNYNFSKTISYYQSQGVPDSMLLMGVPYYAYQWPTQGQYAPSGTTGNGTAFTFANIMNNGNGNYTTENKHREPNSFAPYYSFQTSGWNQCFLDDKYSMGKKFDIVNYRNLGGIGIWALGYDNGYTDFWDLIDEKFSVGNDVLPADTIFDSGGPSWDYYDDEAYTYTIKTPVNTQIHLSFSHLETEAAYDTLWIFDGADTTASLIGYFSGDSIPPLIIASGNILTLYFTSDAATTASGWRAVYDTLPVSGIDELVPFRDLLVYPNPASDFITINIPQLSSHQSLLNNNRSGLKGVIYSSMGQIVKEFFIPEQEEKMSLNISELQKGFYELKLVVGGCCCYISQFVKY